MTGEHPQLDAYVDGALDAEARARVEAHLVTCDRCTAEVAALVRLARELGALPVPDPGDRYWSEFAARVAARLGPERPRPQVYEHLTGWLFRAGRPAWWRAAGALAACSVLVWVGMRGFRPQQVGAPGPVVETRPAPPPAEPVAPAPGAETTLPMQADSDEGIQEPLAEVTPSRAREARVRDRDTPRPEEPELPRPAAGLSQTSPVERQDAPRSLEPERQLAASPPPEPTPSRDEQVAADAVSRFLAAATAGDTASARALLAGLSPAEAAELDAPMRRWLAASHPIEQQAKLSSKMRTYAQSPALVPAPSDVEALLALDDLAWPRRDRDELRPALETLAERLAAHASDPRAAGRARVILEWLAATSQSEDERARWNAALGLLREP